MFCLKPIHLEKRSEREQACESNGTRHDEAREEKRRRTRSNVRRRRKE